MKIISIILCILVTLTSCSLINTNSTSQSEIINQTQNILPKEVQKYIEKNLVSVSEKNISDMFKTIDTAKYDIIFTGEAHGISNNYKVKYELIKYLSKNWNLKYIFTEVGFAAGQYLNIYFETGDESYLDKFVKDSDGLSTYSYEEYEYYKKIYEYNKDLSENKKIKIIGIDIEKNIKTALRYIDYLFKDINNKSEILKLISEYANNDKYTNSNLWEEYNEIIKNILSDFDNNKNKYKTILNEKYDEYEFIINNISAMYKYYESTLTDEITQNRLGIIEKQIANNFIDIYENTDGKIYCDLSSLNVMQKNNSKYLIDNGLLAKLMSDNILDKSKICSIDFYYENSQILLNNQIYDISYDRSLTETHLIENNLKKDYSIINLNKDDSPFTNKNHNEILYYGDGCTADFVQHIIFIKNSPAATIYSNLKNTKQNKIIDTANARIDKYLSENMLEVTEDNISDIFNLIDISKYDIIARGELHGIKSNFTVDFEIIKYLTENWNLKYILLERSFTFSQYINLYLKTGNEEFLDNALLYTEWPNDERSFFKGIYEYNRTLSEEKKLTFIGNETETFFTRTFLYLEYLLNSANKPMPSKIINNTFMIRKNILNKPVDKHNMWGKYARHIENSISFFDDNSSLYKEFLEDKYDEFKYIMDNLAVTYKLELEDREKGGLTLKYLTNREKLLYKNFNNIYSNIKGKHIYLTNGNYHVMRKEGNPYIGDPAPYISKLINNKDINSSKLCIISTKYQKCESLHTGKFIEIDEIFNYNLQYTANTKMKTNYAIVKAPTNNINLSFGRNYAPESDFYDYALIIKNSKAAN